MRNLIPLLFAAFVIAPIAWAEPADKEIPNLIQQLGDDSPKVREDASERLRKIGKDALPALAEAQKSTDPEVSTRAQSVTKRIDEDLHPKPRLDARVPGILRLGGPGNNVQIRMQTMVLNGNGRAVSITRDAAGNTVRETTVKDDGKTIKIREDGDGIAVTTTQKVDDKEVTETTKAKDKDALKKDNPKVYELYEKHSKPAEIQIQGLNGPLKIEGFDAGGQVDVEKVLRDARKLSDEHRKQAEEKFREAQKQLDEQAEKK